MENNNAADWQIHKSAHLRQYLLCTLKVYDFVNTFTAAKIK